MTAMVAAAAARSTAEEHCRHPVPPSIADCRPPSMHSTTAISLHARSKLKVSPPPAQPPSSPPNRSSRSSMMAMAAGGNNRQRGVAAAAGGEVGCRRRRQREGDGRR
ncbi:hypothetical protein Dimus_033722 [Dionaea muscipula]